MARTRVATLALAASVSASLALAHVRALAEPPVAAGNRGDAAPSSGESTTETAEAAAIALDTTTVENTELSALLVELLERSGVRVQLTSMARFDPESLFSGGESDHAVRVFIDTSAGPRVRLYFRGPLAKRFLLRELELRGGLDEIGREAVAQVVEASVTALLRTSAGMSREQTRRALAASGGQALPETGAHAEPPPQPTVSVDAHPVSAWFGIRYAAQWSGADLGGAHGPGAEIGVQWGRAPFARVSVSGERWFSQSVSSPEILATLQTTSVRAGLELGWPLGRRQAGLLGLEAGMDLVGIAPMAPPASPVAPADSRTHVVPMGRATARYELTFEVWRLALTGFVDAAVFATHYDVQRGTSYDRIADPWPLRPGAAVVLAWQPSFDR